MAFSPEATQKAMLKRKIFSKAGGGEEQAGQYMKHVEAFCGHQTCRCLSRLSQAKRNACGAGCACKAVFPVRVSQQKTTRVKGEMKTTAYWQYHQA